MKGKFSALKCILLSLFACVILSGCIVQEEMPAAEDIGITGTPSDTDDIPADNISFHAEEDLLPDWSNWTSDSLWNSYGGALNLFADENRRFMFGDAAKVVDGKLTVYVYFRGEADDRIDDTFNSTFVVLVNGKVCDFELNGKQSSNGRMVVERAYGTEYFEKLTVSDCDLKKGENTITVLAASYFRQIGHSSENCFTRPFYSDIERTQSSVLTKEAAELPGVEFSYGTEVPVKASDFIFDRISFEESMRCMVIPENGVHGFEQMNSASDGTGLPERRVLCFVMKNGELLTAWDGAELLTVDFTSDTVSAAFPISCTVERGEYALFSFFAYDIDGDDFTRRPPDRLFFGSTD